MSADGQLFPDEEMRKCFYKPPLTLYADKPTYNYVRGRKGLRFKVTLRSPERRGRIVATVYTGIEDANEIVAAVNEAARRK